MTKYCCENCFGDRGLKKNIIPSLSSIYGDCTYCGSKSVNIINPSLLSPYFSTLTSIYERNSDGKSLVENLKGDWELFSHPNLDVAHSKELLGDILDDGNIVRENFVLSKAYKSESLAQWDNLCQELMHKNRYFLSETLDRDRLEHLLSFLVTDNIPLYWFRARIFAEENCPTIDNMGAPPKRLASHGRANPIGIPYLYLGSEPKTAISEIRPHTGDKTCVAKFKLTSDLAIIDLRTPRKTVSPFLLAEQTEMGKMLSDIPFLERLGNELTRPVLPKSAALDYIPSQYICEFIKKVGFHGVLYNSSVSDGVNLAIFEPSNALAEGISVYHVDKVEVNISDI
ncbi:hypothetical protein AC068_09340 [Morganella morganii]|uniref:RES family NAD+ phosphorylase n=1 Tax=Morganella morganii TaxID=582 RepID=UPI0006C111C9|nr:RES family NAD+ phosphorylase [Morganella morganii]KOO19014.1 hypothetical protein AC068_09340 [Morganella morganii]MBT0396614.1 RES family NAD+ phosphorylase [Morganella morganii subsp. morganii]